MADIDASATPPGRMRVSVVPHTHWDREWYSSFQVFRMRLVELLDEFLPRLEADLSYARFLLDGQMALVDDYLEVRPEAEPRLLELAASGRLSMGPWYTLPDEFLVSGETHVRNLQLGLARATAFGGAMEVGYLPDMFGHVAQMPQIMRLFGFDHAVVWRGVPAAVDRTAFWWSAPDGSTVRAEYLPAGYGNGAAVPDDAKALVQRVASHVAELGDQLVGDLLFMNGTDHQVPQPWLGRVVAEANEMQDDYELVVTSLAEHLAGAPIEGLPSWTGEMRSGARANVLMGVASNRVDVKQAAARAERSLERLAEPLSALFLPPRHWPASLLDVAWRQMLRNAAHDSVCACSADEVVDAVLHRYAEARQIGDGLAERALAALGASTAESGTLVVNPSPGARSGTVEMVVAGEDPVPGAQLLEARSGGRGETRLVRSSDVAALLGQIRGGHLEAAGFVQSIDVESDETGVDVVLRTGPRRPAGTSVEEARRRLYSLLGRQRQAWYRLRVDRQPAQRVAVRVAEVPGYGWARWSPEVSRSAAVVTTDETTMSNGLARVVVDPSDGTFSLDGVAGLDRLVDGGDQGDTYNYSPPEHDSVVDRPDAAEVHVVEHGPVRGVIDVRRTYTWPAEVDDASGSRVGRRPTVVDTRLELHAGERFVRVTTAFDNRSRDHRLRTWFPLPRPATTSRAECAFAVVERGLEAEGGTSERALPTYPSRRFVVAGGVTVAHEGLLEYEVVDGGTALALTLLRCTAMLSRGPMAYRPEPAGPPLVLAGPQMQGSVGVRYAVCTTEIDPYRMAEAAFLPLQVVTSVGGGGGPSSGTALEIEGGEVSALTRTAGALELRVFNPTDAPVTVGLRDRSGWIVDLRGRPLHRFEGQVELGPWAIATLRLPDQGSS